MPTNIGTAFFNVTFNTAAARREVTSLVSNVNRQFGLIGGVAAVGATAAIAGLVRTTFELGEAALSSANDFEQAFANVRKTLDEGSLSAGEADVVFDRLKTTLRDLALDTPLDLEDDITQVAALGAQLGIATGDLEEFTKVISEVGVTTNISVNDAATGFARLGNIMGVTSDEFRALGDSLIQLGNRLPAQEDEILRFSLRTAAAGEIVGFTTDEVLALSGAMASVGVPAERGGTAIQRTMIKIEQAVATGSASLALFGEVSGLTAEEFASLWERDASEAFTRFVEGLGQSGSQAFGILSQLELAEQRTLQALLSIANAGPLLRDSFKLGADAAGALARESGIFFDTTQARIKLLENTVNDAAITIGEDLQGPFRDILASITDWVDQNPELIEQIGTGLADALETLGDLLEENLPLLESILATLPGLVTEVLATVDPILDLARAFFDLTEAYVNFRNEVRDEENIGETIADAGSMNFFESIGSGFAALVDQFHDNFNTLALDVEETAHLFDDRSTLSKALYGVEQAFGAIGVAAEGALRREGLELMERLAEGADPIEATAQAFVQLQDALEPLGEELTADMWDVMIEGIAFTDEGMLALVERARELGVEVPRAVEALLDLVYVSSRVPRGRGDRDEAPNVPNLPDFDFVDPAEIEAEKKAQEDFAKALADVRDGFIESGLSAETYLGNINLLNPEMAEFVNQTGQARVEAELFNAAVDSLRTAMLRPAAEGIFGVGDLVEGIKQVTRQTKLLDGTIADIPVTAAYVTDQIIENMNEIAEFEANLTILFASGFESLARLLRDQGPEFADIAEEYANNFSEARVADAALESGGVLGDETQAGLDEALNKAGDNPALMEFVSSFGSLGVLQSVYSEGLAVGDNFGQGAYDGARPWLNQILDILGIEGLPSGPAYNPPETDIPNNPGGPLVPAPPPPPGGGGIGFELNFLGSGSTETDAVRAAQIINALVLV